MTQQKRSGMDAKKFMKEMAELKPGTGVDGYEYGANLHTDGVRIEDPQEGKTVSIRVFEFKMNPDPKVNFPTDNQVLFNAHAKQIATILWGDGLVPLEEVPPRVIIKRKEHKYQIFVPCEAKRGVLFFEQPKSLNEVLTKASKN